jgi:Protein of unknown function (DUF3575)
MNVNLYPCILVYLLFTLSSTAQETQDRQPPRWLLSANPLGLAELPAAAGLGIGYRLNEKMEIWTEPSLLLGARDVTHQTSGYRVILQFKKFFGPEDRHFLAIEGRIKSYHFNDTGVFSNPKTDLTLRDVSFHSQNLIYGGALQYGYRMNIAPHSSHWLFEITAGLGLKNKVIHLNGPPSGYLFKDTNVDLNIWDFLENSGPAPYFPGSLRILYLFGKK